MLSTAALCLALNVYHEARNQSIEGMKAVAAVTYNRANKNPDKVCDEVFKPKQFSWANRLTTVKPSVRRKRANEFVPKDERSWERAKKVAQSTINGENKSVAKSATHFYSNKITPPPWSNRFVVVARIDNHIFLR